MSYQAPTPIPSTTLKPHTRYTVPQFLDINDPESQVRELVLMGIVSKGLKKNRTSSPFEFTATGAKFLEAIEASQRVVELFRSRPVHIQVPGGGLISMSEPMPLLFTEMFNVPRKS